MLCHTNLKNWSTITVQEKRHHINTNRLFVCTSCQRACERLKSISWDESDIGDAVCGMGNRESNGKNFSNLAPYWFLLLSFPCPQSRMEGKPLTYKTSPGYGCLLTRTEGKRQRGRKEVVIEPDASIKVIYCVNCLKKKRFNHIFSAVR